MNPLIYIRYKAPNGKVYERPYSCDLESALFQLAANRCSYVSWWFAT